MKFADIIGQEHVKTRLRNTFHEGRIAHALMFLGPEGSGNLAMALAFAQYIVCKDRTEEDSCGKCNSCRKISAAEYPDMHFTFPFFNIEGTKDTTCNDWMKEWRPYLIKHPYTNLDQWREEITKDNKLLHMSVYEALNIIHRLSLKSFDGGYKFQIIWMAEHLKEQTANKLLKIIEEPPENTLFFLVASSLENILPTVLSRVQVIHVPKVEDVAIEHALRAKGASEAKAAEISHFAHGDWNRALQLLSSSNPDENYSQKFQIWMRACYKKDVVLLIKWADEMHGESRDEQKHFLQYALDQIRQNLMLNYVNDGFVRMNLMEKSFSDKFSPFINDLNAEELMEEITEAHHDISRNVYSKLVLADLSMKVHYLLCRK